MVKGQTLIKSNFLAWTGLRNAVPSNLCVNIPDFKAVFDLNNYKCRDYYCYLIKKMNERPRKWNKIGKEFDLIGDLISKTYLLPIRVLLGKKKETANHLFFCCSFSHSFWSEVTDKILKKFSSCECLLLRDVMIGILKEEMDLVNYVIILWTCRQKVI